MCRIFTGEVKLQLAMFWTLPIVPYYKERNFPESGTASSRRPQNRTLLLSWDREKGVTSILGSEKEPPILSSEY
jgi:hypothetical protein